jgi:hypothetical protein
MEARGNRRCSVKATTEELWMSGKISEVGDASIITN